VCNWHSAMSHKLVMPKVSSGGGEKVVGGIHKQEQCYSTSQSGMRKVVPSSICNSRRWKNPKRTYHVKMAHRGIRYLLFCEPHQPSRFFTVDRNGYKHYSTTDITLHIIERGFLLDYGVLGSDACRINLNTEVAAFFETSIRIYQTTRRHPRRP
jgi:hypothetical protein